jgi:hypothetical protein
MPASSAVRDLSDFLVEAKRRTYAAQGDESSVTPTLPGSKQLEYQSAAFSYRDIYFGVSRFVGQEVAFRDGEPVWSMAYAGGLILPAAPTVQSGPVFGFLRRALLLVEPPRPFRGPATFSAAGFDYVNESDGDVAAFRGAEWISRDGVRLYRLDYAGGLLET